ncbi:DNA helicase [Microbacterium phage LilyLou]|uniref:DNA helicase n=2 Tax=Tinytimothyvirus alex44 TaxID=2845588 RepID=A0A4Y6EFA1_9CAUD|nr:DNA primase [Microbacterium phage ArMaWen]QDF16031.1 DNA helicase [Microbacterium phage LilyLou]QPX62648.1 DNA primase [Microbacterium phage Xitlalli]WNM73214.1 DNA primase [Microbacterium phage DumpQuist]
MPNLRTPAERADAARTLAKMFELVEYQGHLYMPVHFMTAKIDDIEGNDTKVWTTLDKKEIRFLANRVAGVLFGAPSEEVGFRLMLSQFATAAEKSDGILVRMGTERVQLLQEDGTFTEPTGEFVANYLDVPYQTADKTLATYLFGVITEWVGSKEAAISLLHHIATALQPKWSAVKYVILLGSGRNGKSTLMKMVYALLGRRNVSKVKRQDMAKQSTIITALNGKLMNIVFDGPKEFIKDSSAEKTLIAGEPLDIELKYENMPFEVQTNALFMEGLQHEPKVSDKSQALQARLVRFKFPNKYAKDLMFEKKMLREEMLAALLQLLLDHWVNENELDEKLALTAESLDMQMSAIWAMSPVLRFLEWMALRDQKFLQEIVAKQMVVEKFMTNYRKWLENNGYRNMEDDYILQTLNDNFEMKRKTVRPEGKPTTRLCIVGLAQDTDNAIQTLLQGGQLEHADVDTAVLED